MSQDQIATLDETNEESVSPPRTLAAELRFSPDDLAANRAGRLSEMQHYTLRVQRRRAILTGLGIMLVVIIIATGLIYAGTRNGGSDILTMLGIGLTICNAALGGVFARHWMRLNADIQKRVVIANSGELERVIKPVTRRVVNYMIRVDEAEVFVSRELFEIFEHGEAYTLYRVPYTGKLLSAAHNASAAHDAEPTA